MKALLVALLFAFSWFPVAAQYDDDDSTSDYEEQDRRYLERLNNAKKPQATSAAIEDPSAAFLELAEKLVRDRNYSSAKTARYFVQSDDPRLDAQATAALLENFRDHFDAFWRDRFELAPYEKTSRVFLLYSFYKYNQLLAGDFRFSAQRPEGHYGSLYDAISLHSDADGGPGSTPDALIHEATHQLIDQRVFGGAPPRAYWLTEGLASYFGYTRLDAKEGFQDGAIGGKSVSIFSAEKNRPGQDAKLALRESAKTFKTYAKTHDQPLVARLLAIDSPSGFYADQPQLNYTASWLLIHTLFHAEDGRYQQGFLRYLAREAAGEGGAAALLEELSLDVTELQAALQAHVGTLKAR
jgi:hypothetical protein